VFDVTRSMSLRIAAVLAVVALAVVVTLGLTISGSGPVLIAAPLPLTERVPGAVLPTATAGAVLPAAGEDAPVPVARSLKQVLAPLISAQALGRGVSVDVLDPLTGDHLLTAGASGARTPASTAKLLTAAAVLTALGPQTTLVTTTVSGPDPDEVILVGGGDVLLAAGKGDPDEVNGRAGLGDLAQQTAASLKANGQTSAQLRLDDRLFTGSARAPGWADSDVDEGFVAPIQALEVDAGRVASGHYAQRSADPAMLAANRFAKELTRRGIRVNGVRRLTGSGTTDTGAVLGQVRSAPVSGLVEYTLTESDNTVAEALGHLVAVSAGGRAGFKEAGPAVLAQLRGLGVPVAGAVLTDTSGLGDGSRVPPQALTAVLALATDADQPQLRSILSGLPVAAVSGTLSGRFTGADHAVAGGVVRAKTGTLTGVSSLAGTVVDRDGRLLVFAAMADQVKSTVPARNALDRLATTLATCGCR
jgi:D-alanyl-D-alanine carboxypeptidase/D-alanyl-D-alanine-endopeptidase (penicillin-binding protein 4)